MIKSVRLFQPAAILRKVPEVTIYFWIIKVLTTAMGEVLSDSLVSHFNPEIVVLVCGLGLAAALAVQLAARSYVAWMYWSVVSMVAVFGTMAADVVHTGFGVPYAISTLAFAVVLALVFGAWYASERTLSIHSIASIRREVFYWTTVIVTFALGTAVGDLTASTMHMGYYVSGLLFAALIALAGIAYWRLGVSNVLAFWAAYILTRPLGASFADWAAKPVSRSGLGFGSGRVSVVLLLLIVAFVGYMTITQGDQPMEHA